MAFALLPDLTAFVSFVAARRTSANTPLRPPYCSASEIDVSRAGSRPMNRRFSVYAVLSIPLILLVLVGWTAMRPQVFISSDLVEVRNAPGMGRGLFAKVPIREGTPILRDYTIGMEYSDVEALMESFMKDYYFFDYETNRGYVVFGKTSLINHSYLNPNVEPEWEATERGVVVIMRALRDIRPGEQLFFDYGFAKGEYPDWADNPR